MSNKTKAAGVAAVVLSAACIFGAVIGNGGFRAPQPGVTVDQPGDCDAGDLREKTPDPGCRGLWLGTPTPGTKKTTPAPRPKTSPTRSPR